MRSAISPDSLGDPATRMAPGTRRDYPQAAALPLEYADLDAFWFEEDFDAVLTHVDLCRLIRTLHGRDRRIMVAVARGKQQREIAIDYGLAENWLSRIVHRNIRRMRARAVSGTSVLGTAQSCQPALTRSRSHQTERAIA